MKKQLFKRIVCMVLCVLFSVSLSGACLAAESRCKTRTLDAVAHRGYSAAAPENTLAAIRLASENGYSSCEFDIHPTKDGVWVVNHDNSVDRMTDGTGNISDLTYDEISAMKIDAGNNVESYPNEKIPTLEEALDLCEECKIHPVIEVKGGKEEDMPSLAELLSARSFSNGYTLISFTWEYLAPLRELLPTAEMWMLANEVMPSHIRFCKQHNIDGISFNYTKNTALSMLLAKACGLKLIAWTVDSKAAAQRLYLLGVSAVTTNALLPQELDMTGVTVFDLIKTLFNC